ncbi:hypothetical protein LTR62_008134 [Meristemomyces frigidus]|uniref:Ubiquitin carboxyl-terminal hydrolase n=1 Tax=Meristemomyces frigidus TaxID=1508187 RepID=A0AAN7YNI6_9PEZI|nr:hypothetical protein LTR62_008134 [Meristemomyces frigidus]
MATTTLTPTSASAEPPKLLKKSTPGDTRTSTSPAPTFYGCQHVKGLLQAARQQAIDGYNRTLREKDGLGARTYKSSNGPTTTTAITYLCLQCPSVSISRERHTKGHAFAVESEFGYLWCHDCRDYVYDPTFEALRTVGSKKRKHTQLPAEERKLLAANTAPTSCAATGLRGFYNMGQTCFMSVILQSLVHNPLIRASFLNEAHKSSECEREACTACAMDDIFTDFYGTEKHEGYGAVHMLQGCWKNGGNMAGYSQQDAHEFLGFILNSLHTAIEDDEDEDNGSTSKKAKDTSDCECVIHQVFSGLLKSTVTCTKCRNVTTAMDPFMDLSLDIRSAATSVKKKKLALTNGTQTIKEVRPMDLYECLDRFTSVETLTSDDYHCIKCDENREAKKKLSLHTLPPVIPIHLKRFSHSKTSSQSSKVETKIHVPFTFDFAPYLASSDASERSKTNGKELDNGHKSSSAAKGEDEDADADADADGEEDEDATTQKPSEPEYEALDTTYELFSVVIHKGKIDNGHYICYCRQGEHGWFRFDDSMVVQVEDREVLGAEAYMVFYVARGFATEGEYCGTI